MANLLIVEDDPMLLMGMKDLLASDGHRVRAVSSGLIALDAIETEQPQLIICDVRMPGMNGPQLLEVVRAHSRRDSIPFLFISAGSLLDALHSVMQLSHVSYLRKPFEIEALRQAVSNSLAEHNGVWDTG